MENPSRLPAGARQPLPWSALLIGFALGGFFDGILLHQVLQWHHLLSGVAGEAVQDLRVQVLADGLFHLLMYVIAVAGLWMLWMRRAVAAPSARLLWASAMIGFGTWHVLDGVVSHWLLGIHRIRMDSPNALFWDLLWFFVFGMLMIGAGLLLRARESTLRSGHRGTLTASILLTGAVMLGGPATALPPADLSTFVVVMRPGADIGDLLDGLGEVGGGILWSNAAGSLWTVKLDNAGDGARLYRHGALFVTGSPAVLGCAAWNRVAN